MFFPEQTPHNSQVFYDHVKWHDAQSTAQTQPEFEHSKSVNGERLHNTEDVHVDVHARNECAQKIHQRWTRNGAQGR